MFCAAEDSLVGATFFTFVRLKINLRDFSARMSLEDPAGTSDTEPSVEEKGQASRTPCCEPHEDLMSSLEALGVICGVSKRLRKATSCVEEALGVTCVATTGLCKLLLLLFSSSKRRISLTRSSSETTAEQTEP